MKITITYLTSEQISEKVCCEAKTCKNIIYINGRYRCKKTDSILIGIDEINNIKGNNKTFCGSYISKKENLYGERY
mgnify:CR=1 FL=1